MMQFMSRPDVLEEATVTEAVRGLCDASTGR
jgi:hypothetical protein